MKKIFTLIAVAAMAIGAQAQTVINFAGLSHADFTYDDKQYSAVTWTDTDDDTKTAPAFSYIIGGSTWAELTLKDKNVSFRYKNSGTKDNFFVLNSENFAVGGKGVELKIANVKKDQRVTINVAKKEDPTDGKNQIPGFSVTGASLESGEMSAELKKENYVDFVYAVSADGTIVIKNADNGYLLKTITIADGEAIVETGVTETVTFDVATAAEKEALAYERVSTEGNVKATVAKLNKFDTTKGPSLKDGSTLTITVPEGKSITKIQMVIGGSSSGSGTKWKLGEETLDNTGYKFKEETQEYKLKNSSNSVTLTVAAGSETTNFYLTSVSVTYDNPSSNSIQTVNSLQFANGIVYNLAGQKVGESYKGVVIKNGKKAVQK